jgi:uncharacterized protein
MDAFQNRQRKVIATIVAATILAIGIWQGLRLVGDGLAAKAGNAITITGQAKTTATADKVVWTLNVQENAKSVGPAVQKVEKSVVALKDYLTQGGIAADAIEVGGVNTYANNEYKNGNLTGVVLSYTANQNVIVRSQDVMKVKDLSNGIGSLLQTGVSVNNYGPQYYVSNLSELRPQLLADAMKDAKLRGETMTKAVGTKLGPVLAVSSGPVQVTAPDSTDTSAGGMYDTTTIPKTVSVTVSVSFKVSK